MKLKIKLGIGLKKNFLIIVIFMVISSLILSGCSEEGNILTDEEQRFIGTWYAGTAHGSIVNEVIAFFPDGFCSYFLNLNALWKIEDGKIVFTLEDREEIFDYEFSNGDLNLRIFDEATNQDMGFRKQ